MPIFRINNDLHYFAHVPKCGGASVETYLADRFGPMGFWDMHEEEVLKSQRWIRTSPQHVPVVALDRLMPRDWFVSSFAVVRHPVRRLISAFFFSRDIVGRIPLGAEFNAWFAEASAWIGKEPYRNGGHLEPQVTIVPPGSRIFRLEEGLEAIVPYLDGLAGNSDGPREIPVRNVGRWRQDEAPPVLNAQTLELVRQIYAEDFAQFGYAPPTSAEDLGGLTDLPLLAATGKPPAPPARSLSSRITRYLYKQAGL
jgi:hypothetical protein